MRMVVAVVLVRPQMLVEVFLQVARHLLVDQRSEAPASPVAHHAFASSPGSPPAGGDST
jgi:hypothetical protein